MIICFSGTGNSLYAAQRIGLLTEDTVVTVTGLMKNGGQHDFTSDRPFVFVCPTYAWRIPRVFESLIRESRFSGSGKAYFVMTCGGETGNAVHYLKKLCHDKGFELMGLKSVVMPENYIALFKVPDREKAAEIIRRAEPEIGAAAGYIKEGSPLPGEKITLVGRIYSTIVNPFFYPFFAHAAGFYTTEACIGCGQCAGLCPLNNITMISERPVWGNRCTHCMACICSCPTEAIEYKKNSLGKPRYRCPISGGRDF